MELRFVVVYQKEVVTKDIPALSREWSERIRSAIENKLTSQPEIFGKPLRRSLAGYRKLRIGDYRVVFKIEKRTITILAILHRSVVYQMIEKRV